MSENWELGTRHTEPDELGRVTWFVTAIGLDGKPYDLAQILPDRPELDEEAAHLLASSASLQQALELTYRTFIGLVGEDCRDRTVAPFLAFLRATIGRARAVS